MVRIRFSIPCTFIFKEMISFSIHNWTNLHIMKTTLIIENTCRVMKKITNKKSKCNCSTTIRHIVLLTRLFPRTKKKKRRLISF
ncbi:hypothetical protein TorRG33x02_242150 [Trema orientale]|uniref:Uncharacterized protein n=1 Tax=Trema orientale TaxID=63057 RepID=A0A2P5DU27_TREOI|nr:hypothetical protein TorRG33x02_242150 [Trema orientale]